jgi:hypothetical protein
LHRVLEWAHEHARLVAFSDLEGSRRCYHDSTELFIDGFVHEDTFNGNADLRRRTLAYFPRPAEVFGEGPHTWPELANAAMAI